MPLVKESTPDHDLYDTFKRALKIFLRAYQNGVQENIQEEDALEQELQQAAVQYQATTANQTEPQPAI